MQPDQNFSLPAGIGQWSHASSQTWQKITHITADSRLVREGSLYACLTDDAKKAQRYAQEAIKHGAVLLLTAFPVEKFPCYCVPFSYLKECYISACRSFYGAPEEALCLFGITGTNGKTTTAHILCYLLKQSGERVGMTGTVTHQIADQKIESHYTTPLPEEYYSLLAQMKEERCSCCVSELSSQGLAQGRADGLNFFCGIFTNLSQDHLDYHGTMEQYYQAKKKLFLQCKNAVINVTSPWGKRLSAELKEEIPSLRQITFSIDKEKSSPDWHSTNSDWRCMLIDDDAQGVSFVLSSAGQKNKNKENCYFCRCSLPLPGDYNVENAAGAILAYFIYRGYPTTFSLSSLPPVAGRLERIPTGRDFSVYIDYAHTPDSLERTLKALQKLHPRRLFCLFGCGGDRDKTKRPQMGAIAVRYCDAVIVTDDNPRSEDPKAIIEDILRGITVHSEKCTIIPNRMSALLFALGKLKTGDILLLAGKGHEHYQWTANGKINFDEKQIVTDFLSKNR